MNDIVVRLATEADLASVLAIAEASRTAPQWTLGDYRACIAPVDADASLIRSLLVVSRAGVVLGFAVTSVLHSVYPAEAELESIAVASQARNQGMGRALVEAAVAWAAAHRADVLRLEVRRSNAAAQQLYLATGFVITGERRGYYSNPVEDAVLMCRTIPLQS